MQNNSLLCAEFMSKNKKAETGDNVVMVGVCAAGLSFISWSLFYFIYFFPS